MAAAVSVCAVAQDAAESTVFTINGITYEVQPGQTEATITGFDADMEHESLTLASPVSHDGVPYTLAPLPEGTDSHPGILSGLRAKNIVLDNVVLSPYSFYGNGNIESVVFTSTGEAASNPLQNASYAFADCSELTAVSAADATDITSLPEAIFRLMPCVDHGHFPRNSHRNRRIGVPGHIARQRHFPRITDHNRSRCIQYFHCHCHNDPYRASGLSGVCR